MSQKVYEQGIEVLPGRSGSPDWGDCEEHVPQKIVKQQARLALFRPCRHRGSGGRSAGGHECAARRGARPGGQAERDKALRLAFQAQAELTSYQEEGLIRSVLLATESLRRAPTAEAGETLQAGLALLPRWVNEWSDRFRSELVSSDDRWAVSRLGAGRELWELPGASNALTQPRRIAQLTLDGDTLGMGFGPGGNWLLTWTADRLQMWQADTGRLVDTWSPDPMTIHHVESSADKRRLFLVGTDGIQILDASRLPRNLQFTRAVFSPDGKQLATTDTQGNVRFWFWRPDDLIAEACQHVTRNLTAQEWQQYFGDRPSRRTCDHLPALDNGNE